ERARDGKTSEQTLIPPDFARSTGLWGRLSSRREGNGTFHALLSARESAAILASGRGQEAQAAAAEAFFAATIWSAVRPVSSAMWSNLAVKVPTPAVAERISMIRSPISVSG